MILGDHEKRYKTVATPGQTLSHRARRWRKRHLELVFAGRGDPGPVSCFRFPGISNDTATKRATESFGFSAKGLKLTLDQLSQFGFPCTGFLYEWAGYALAIWVKGQDLAAKNELVPCLETFPLNGRPPATASMRGR